MHNKQAPQDLLK